MSNYLSNNLFNSAFGTNRLQQNSMSLNTDDANATISDSGLNLETGDELLKKEVLEKIEQLKQQSPENIEEYNMLIEELNSGELNIDEVYQSLVGNNSNVSDFNQNSDIQSAVISTLENQIEELENELETAKSQNGLIGKIWDGFKNLTGIGASSSKAQDEIDKLKEQLEACKNGKVDFKTGIRKYNGKRRFRR